MLGRLWPVSVLTLGGGGVGQLWGPTTRDESIATIRTAVDCGITLLDMAPAYGNGEAENVVGTAFDGRLPAGVRVTTKHRLGTPPTGEVEGNIVRSLNESLARVRLERVDLFFLHSNIIPDDYDASAYVDRPATRWTTYIERFIPVCERLVADGRIGAWGITGIGVPECILAALGETSRPAAVQCITNPIDSPGELKYFAGPSRAREIIAASNNAGTGVLGIRPVQGGAFTDALDRQLPPDHGVVTDFERGTAFRMLARELGTSSAALAHRYALSMPGVETVVLGCKNRKELLECVAAAEAGPLEPAVVSRIDAAFLSPPCVQSRSAG
jgi:aryl-alcohol dehydrogenase-like predicted oxidoreductase